MGNKQGKVWENKSIAYFNQGNFVLQRQVQVVAVDFLASN